MRWLQVWPKSWLMSLKTQWYKSLLGLLNKAGKRVVRAGVLG